MKLAATITLFTSLLALNAGAQVTARQGTPPAEAQEQHFHSPMELDLPFYGADRRFWNQGQLRGKDSLALFDCDGVTFRDFAYSVNTRRGKKLDISFHVILANEPGVDQLATVKFQLLRDGKPFAQAVVPWCQVEEGRITIRDVSTTIDESGLTATPPPILRITLTTKIDD